MHTPTLIMIAGLALGMMGLAGIYDSLAARVAELEARCPAPGGRPFEAPSETDPQPVDITYAGFEPEEVVPSDF